MSESVCFAFWGRKIKPHEFFRPASAVVRVMDDEELDDALEREFQRPLLTPFAVPSDPFSSSSSSPSSSSSSSATLTFSFPGWGVEIYRDSKRRKPSVVRHSFHDFRSLQQQCDVRRPNLTCGYADDTASGHCIYKMPDEIIANVFSRLDIRDLCTAIHVCRWWQHLGTEDGLWEHFVSDYKYWEQFESDSNKNQTSMLLPRWQIVKNNALCAQVQNSAACSHGHLSKGFSHLRLALRAWWETGSPEEPYCSKSIRGLIRKLTMHDWTVLYDFLTVAFAERADCLAASLLEEVREHVSKSGKPICPFKCDHRHQLDADESQLVSGRHDFLGFSHKEYQSSIECVVGKTLWGLICTLWRHYKRWLMLIFEHCTGLNQEVMVEKARTPAWNITTPTLYEKGVICFRSQVLLKYGLRRVLQLGFYQLAWNDVKSEMEVNLLESGYHLLEELDVRDDSLSPRQFTQAKLRRCFPFRKSRDG